MSVPGFPHTMDELGNRVRSERQRLERERLESEYSRHFPCNDDPILEHTIGELRRHTQREDRIVRVWSWFFAIVVIGGLMGLCVWLMPPEFVIAIAISLMIAASVGIGIVWHDRRKYPSGGTL